MYDVYERLIITLDEMQSTEPKTQKKALQEIKLIAEKLSEQSTTIEQVLDASFCYYISGYYIHAQVLSNVDFRNAHTIQRWILYFLAKKISELKAEVSGIVEGVGFQDATIQEDINLGNLNQFDVVNRIVEVKVAESFLDIISFIETGNSDKYIHAINVLTMCQKLLRKAGEWQTWWWIESLKKIIHEFVECSLWQTLQPMRDNPINSEMVSKYITANYKGLSIIEFWRTQIESLPKINDLDRCSFCISVPTSSGKTKAAELAVLRFLLDYWNEPEAKCIYIAPLRTLCEEVEKSFSVVFGQFAKSIVSKFYGSHEIDWFDEYLWAKTRILVVTPEKLDGMIRQNPDLKSQIRLVIADEGHLIGEKDRLTYRFLLERLIYLFRKKSVVTHHKPRIILISGVLPNVEDFAELISGSRDNIVKIDWRPTEDPRFFKWVWNGKGWASWEFDGKNWQKSMPPIPENFQNCKSQDEFADQVVKVAVSQSKSDTATMVFSANKNAIEKQDFMDLLTCIAQHNPYGNLEIIDSNLKAKYPKETYLLENSISVHHSKVESGIKQEIDERVRSGKVRLLFASPTYAQGVNMPFDSALIYKLYHDYNSPISPSMFWNVVGRVGRPIAQLKALAKIRAPKIVFLLKQSDTQNNTMCNDLVKGQGIYRVQSPFLDFLNEVKRKAPSLDVSKLVSELAEKPKLKDVIGEDASMKWGKTTLEQCLSALDRHLIALLEEIDVDITLEWMQQSVKELVELFVQASVIKDADFDYIGEVVLARLKFIAKHIPKEQRRQEYLLGLPNEDCEMIKQNETELMEWYKGSIGLFNNNREIGTENLVSLMTFVMELSICKKGSRKKLSDKPMHSGQLSFGLKVDDKATRTQKKMFATWINGESNDDLLSTHQEFKKYRDIWRNLPWGFSAVLHYLTKRAEENGIVFVDLKYLPSMVKYGVNSKTACHLMRLGIPRKYSIPISDLYVSKLIWDENNASEEVFNHDFFNAIKSLQSLTDEDVKNVGIDKATMAGIQNILDQYKTENLDGEPEFPPFKIESYE